MDNDGHWLIVHMYFSKILSVLIHSLQFIYSHITVSL